MFCFKLILCILVNFCKASYKKMPFENTSGDLLCNQLCTINIFNTLTFYLLHILFTVQNSFALVYSFPVKGILKLPDANLNVTFNPSFSKPFAADTLYQIGGGVERSPLLSQKPLLP